MCLELVCCCCFLYVAATRSLASRLLRSQTVSLSLANNCDSGACNNDHDKASNTKVADPWAESFGMMASIDC